MSEVAGKVKSSVKIYSMHATYYLLFFALVLVATFMGVLPSGMAGAFSICLALAGILTFLGDRTPIVKDYLGGGAFFALFVPATLVMFNVFSENTLAQVGQFMGSPNSFLDFAIVILIAGSLLGVDRFSLRSAIIRYMPCVIACQLAAMIAVVVISFLIGYDFKEALFFVGLPVLGGGIGAGAVPMSKMVGEILGMDPAVLLTQMTSSISLANAMAILGGGLMDRLGRAKPSWSGNGQLISTSKFELKEEKHETFNGDFKLIGVGFFTAMTLMCVGRIIQKFVPSIHAFAWMIIICCVIKIAGVLPKYIEEATYYFSQLLISTCSSVLLVALGLSQISMSAIIESLTLTRFVLVFAAVLFGCIAAMLVGKAIGFHPIEAGITTGLCATDLGGMGDIAILGAAKRMELLPYAAISTRIGGAVILILAGFVARLFL